MSTHEREAAPAAAARDARLPEIDWSVLPPGAVRFDFAAPSGTLAAMSLGDPAHPRVVLVPGITGSKEDFTLLAPLLVEAGYFVESYDLAGQYESHLAGPLIGQRFTQDLFVADLEAFLRAGAPAHVLGYSFGGILAGLVASAHPSLVRSLTFHTTPPLSGQAFRGVRTIGWFSGWVTERQGAGLMIWGIRTNQNRVGPNRLAFVRERFDLTRRSSVDDAIGLMRRTPDLVPGLSALSIPKLVVTGDHDLWPTPLHAAFASSIGAAFAVYRTGHSPCETAPHQLTEDLLSLFATREAGDDPHDGAA
ncbi:alpha/beta fold hydrolase [Plantibacter sp. YIM 135249]|uniref:alpha/beta fold hydrolase n=1 Tax=Plantibacter sp. YIM 135249 TaxID=3423918 RepID=UPI003D32A29F